MSDKPYPTSLLVLEARIAFAGEKRDAALTRETRLAIERADLQPGMAPLFLLKLAYPTSDSAIASDLREQVTLGPAIPLVQARSSVQEHGLAANQLTWSCATAFIGDHPEWVADCSARLASIADWPAGWKQSTISRVTDLVLSNMSPRLVIDLIRMMDRVGLANDAELTGICNVSVSAKDLATVRQVLELRPPGHPQNQLCLGQAIELEASIGSVERAASMVRYLEHPLEWAMAVLRVAGHLPA